MQRAAYAANTSIDNILRLWCYTASRFGCGVDAVYNRTTIKYYGEWIWSIDFYFTQSEQTRLIKRIAMRLVGGCGILFS